VRFLGLFLSLMFAGFPQNPAQIPGAVPVTSEHHHHLAFENSFVRLFKVEVGPHDSTLLHEHDHDYIYIVFGDALITNAVYGKPPLQAKLLDGEVRFARGGFAHVARNDGPRPFRNDTIELLRPQGRLHNLCEQVVPDESLNCWRNAHPPAVEAWPEFETDDTRVVLVRVAPHHEVNLSRPVSNSAMGMFHADPGRNQMFVALDDGVLGFDRGKGKNQFLHPGDYTWINRNGVVRIFKNVGNKDARFILLEIKP
jgi:hypothetical protein